MAELLDLAALPVFERALVVARALLFFLAELLRDLAAVREDAERALERAAVRRLPPPTMIVCPG